MFFKTLRTLLITCFAVTVLTGSMHSEPYGYRSSDPCTACGDTFVFYPNEEGGAQRFPRDWLDWDWGDGNPNLNQ